MNLSNLKLYIVVFSLVLGFSGNLFAGIGRSPEFIDELNDQFFSHLRSSNSKIDQVEKRIKQKLSEHVESLTKYYYLVSGKDIAKARKKAEEEEISLAYKRALKLLYELRNASGDRAYELASQILDLENTSRSDGQRLNWEEYLAYVTGFFKNYEIKYPSLDDKEAYNLVNPVTGSYYTEAEIYMLEKEGVDLSMINPPGDGQHWTNTDIENYNIDRTYNKDSKLFKGINFTMPNDYAEFEFSSVKRSQSKPKLKVKMYVNGKKYKFKMKLLAEMHSEPTVASLAAALGFNTDPSKYVKRPKLYFKDMNEKAIFYRDLESYYGYWNYNPTIAEEGEDAKGPYIIFKECLVEPGNSDHERLGGWPFTDNGNPDKREVRGLSLFMAWVENNDLKESGQNKLVIRHDDEDSLFYVNNDLGWAFGNFLIQESVFWFRDTPIASTGGSGVKFNYKTWHWNGFLDNLTWDDAKWMVRRIARLSREQITDAVGLGRWPEKVTPILIEKLLKRRNALVEAFELTDEFEIIDTEYLNAGRPPEGILPGYSQDFGSQLLTVLKPAIWDFMADQVQASVDNDLTKPIESKLRFSAEDLLGLYMPFSHGLILNIKRDIVRNKEPRYIAERKLINDEVKIGWRLNTKVLGVGSHATYYRRYNLIYPAGQDKERAFFKPNYLLNMLLPYTPGLVKLPNRYTMVIEDYIEGSGSVSFDNKASFVKLKATGSAGKVLLKRYVISDKSEGTLNILEDRSAYGEASLRIQASMLGFGFPLFHGVGRMGHISRDLWSVETEGDMPRERFWEAMKTLFLGLDKSKFEEAAEKSKITSNFIAKRFGLNFFNILKTNKYKRTDHASEYGGHDNNHVRDVFQIDTIHEERWETPIIEFKETKRGRAFLIDVNNTDGSNELLLGLNLKVYDNATTSMELKNDHIKLANKAANDDNFITFSPLYHTNRDQWGSIESKVDLILYERAIDKLLNTSKKKLWETFTRVTGIGSSVHRRDNLSHVDETIQSDFRNFVANIGRAKRTSDRKKRGQYLVKALQNAIVATSVSTGYKGHILGVITEVVGDDDMFLSAKIGPGHSSENIFPSGKPLVNRIGEKKYDDRKLFYFERGGIEYLYNFFDTVLPRDTTTTPSTDYDF